MEFELVVPAIWPFEVLRLPRFRVLRLPAPTNTERESLRQVLKGLLTRCDNLLDASFPQPVGWQGAPTGPAGEPSSGEKSVHWRFHIHLYLPLLRSATVCRFMVGFEVHGEPQRDLAAEQAAGRLRPSPEVRKRLAIIATALGETLWVPK